MMHIPKQYVEIKKYRAISVEMSPVTFDGLDDDAISMGFGEYLLLMAAERLHSAARAILFQASMKRVCRTNDLRRGLGASEKTFQTWRQYLINNGWLIRIDDRTFTAGYRGDHVIITSLDQIEIPPDFAVQKKVPAGIVCSPQLRKQTREVFDYTCQKCGFQCLPGEEKNYPNFGGVDSSFLQVDRLLPSAKAGLYTPDNVTLLCGLCNSKRGHEGEAVGQSLAERLAAQ